MLPKLTYTKTIVVTTWIKPNLINITSQTTNKYIRHEQCECIPISEYYAICNPFAWICLFNPRRYFQTPLGISKGFSGPLNVLSSTACLVAAEVTVDLAYSRFISSRDVLELFQNRFRSILRHKWRTTFYQSEELMHF